MKLTCFITVCACLSSIVSTDQVKYLNRIKKIARTREEFAVKDATVRRQTNSIPQIYPDIFPTSRQFQPQTRIEKLKRNQFQSGPQQQQQQQSQPQPQPQPQPQQQQQQQQQQHRYNRDRLRHSTKRVKTRSIIGSSTYELSNNQLDTIPEVVQDENPIRIEPVLRVIKKKNVLDSIVEILHQLLDPPKNEKGPLVPIQMPGSTRKIYLRLIEPLDSSQVIVRFVTQLPVPVIDAEKQYNPFVPIPSVIDPVSVLLNHAHHGTIHPVLSNDALLASSSSNRHHAVYPPRNVSHVKGSQSIKPVVENSSQNPSKDPRDKGNFSPAVASNGVESDKDSFTDTRVNLQNHEQQLLSQSAASYYQYQAASEEVMNKVKELLNSENATTAIESEGGSKHPSVEPWYQLSTHRLPLRQIAPLHPLTSMEYGSGSGSYADTYKPPPSDVLTGPPSSYSTSYEQYNDAANSAPGIYPSSYSVPQSSYPTSYKQNEINGAPSSYSVPYQSQNEFNGAPSSYPVPYQSPNKFNGAPGSYATSYEKQNDPFGAASAYSSSYEKPPPSSSSYEKQIGASSNDALRIIDPPSYLPDYRTANHANRSFERTATAIRQPRYNNPTVDSSSPGGESAPHHVVWGKSKREKSESSFQKSAEITDAGIDSDKRWQPVVFVHENAGWHEAYEADLARTAATERQPLLEEARPRKSSRGGADQTRLRNSKHRGGAIARDPRCSTSEEQTGCERAKSTTDASTPRSASTVRMIVEKQAQPAVNSDSISIAKSATSNPIEASKPSNVTAKSPSVSATERSSPLTITSPKDSKSMSRTTEGPPLLIKVINSDSTTTTTTTTTERPPLLIKALESTFTNVIAERLIATEASVIKPTVSNVTQKSTTNSTTEKSRDTTEKSKGTTEKSKGTTEKSKGTTEKSLINGATKVSVLSSYKAKKLELPKRPMIMKKPMYIMKRPELSSTTRRPVTTQKPTTISSSTTKRTTVARRSKFPRATSKTKSSTT